MVDINLLPWREHKLRKQRTRFLFQFMFAVSAPMILGAAFWLLLQQVADNKFAEFTKLNSDNLQQIIGLEEHEKRKASYKKQQTKLVIINHFLAQRFNIPELLIMLQKQSVNIDVDYLSIDETAFKFSAIDSSSSSAMLLLNNLREKSNFCQVRVTPTEDNPDSELMEFELQAQFCDE